MDTLGNSMRSAHDVIFNFDIVVLDLLKSEDKEKFDQITFKHDPKIVDLIDQQIFDLLANRHLQKLSKDEYDHLKSELLGNRSIENFGSWIYYPLKNILVHILSKQLFQELRTARNKNKITHNEQEILSTKKIGIIGLSVGKSVASSLALECSFGLLKLADFDTLELSNMNRLLAPIEFIGQKKTDIVKFQIHELDPYLNLKIFPDGINQENLIDFISDLDIIIDEFDDFRLKIKLREVAREYGIPVISEMSDRGMLDIERFDLDQRYPIYHGNISENEIKNIDKLGIKDIIEKIIPLSSISSRMKESYMEIGKSLKTWPQLGSDVMMGGGLCNTVVRKILLKEKIESGRYYFDIDNIISNNINPK